MVRKWLAAALLVALVSLLIAGRASATAVLPSDNLAPFLLTPDEANAVLTALGSSDSITDTADGAPTNDAVVSVNRVYKMSSGIVAIALFGNPDGSALTTEEQNGVLSGQYLQIFANGVFSSYGGFTLGGSTGTADQDQFATFSAVLNGANVNVVADSFIKNNVFGVVLYATPGQNDGQVVGGMLGGEVLKLS